MGKMMDWLAAPGALKRLRAARALLETLTPLHTDCGKLCDGACCAPEEDSENGMLLLPFEDRLYRKPIEGFAFHLMEDDSLFKGGKRLVCEGACPREHRPFACRIFPLRLRVTSDEQGFQTHVKAELDPRARPVCPLLGRGGVRALDPAFVAAAEQAGELLVDNVYMLEALENDQRLVDDWLHF